MRVLVVHPGPAYATADVYRGWVRGLRAAGAEVRSFNLDDRLAAFSSAHQKDEDGEWRRTWPDERDVRRLCGFGLFEACYQFAPHVVLVVSAAVLEPSVYDTIRGRGSKVVILHTESPYEDERQLLVGAHADINLLNDPTNLDRFHELGGAGYVPHAYDPTVHCPGPSSWDLDVGWVGTAGETFPGRTKFLEQVDFGSARVGFAGLWDGIDDAHPLHRHLVTPDTPIKPLSNDETVDVYRGSKLSFNLYRTAGDNTDDGFAGGWAMSPREVELAATGCFFARQSNGEHGGEGDQVLSMLPRFSDPDELSEIVAFYLAHDERREQLADEARAAVAGRTFEAHAAALLTQLT